MRSAFDEVLNVRLPRDLRADLDGVARASGSGLSDVARRALQVGLRAIAGSNDDKPPPPSAPSGAVMPAAA